MISVMPVPLLAAHPRECSPQANPVSTHTGACHSGKQCTAVPTSHYLPTAKRTWQAMLVFIHPCNLVGEMPQTPERFQRNRLRSCGAEQRNCQSFVHTFSLVLQNSHKSTAADL